MQNLEQFRAHNALDRAPVCRKASGDGDCLSGFPSLIVNNGLLAALAYSIEKSTKTDGSLDRRKQWINIAESIAFHLHEMQIARRPGSRTDALWLRSFLAGCTPDTQNRDADSFVLRRATDEALAFLTYLKRFAKSAD